MPVEAHVGKRDQNRSAILNESISMIEYDE